MAAGEQGNKESSKSVRQSFSLHYRPNTILLRISKYSCTIWLSLHSSRSFLPISLRSHWPLTTSSHFGISDTTLCQKNLKNHIIQHTPESLKGVLAIQCYHWPLLWACFPVYHPSSGKFWYKLLYFGRAASVLKDPSLTSVSFALTSEILKVWAALTHTSSTPLGSWTRCIEAGCGEVI